MPMEFLLLSKCYQSFLRLQTWKAFRRLNISMRGLSRQEAHFTHFVHGLLTQFKDRSDSTAHTSIQFSRYILNHKQLCNLLHRAKKRSWHTDTCRLHATDSFLQRTRCCHHDFCWLYIRDDDIGSRILAYCCHVKAAISVCGSEFEFPALIKTLKHTSVLFSNCNLVSGSLHD